AVEHVRDRAGHSDVGPGPLEDLLDLAVGPVAVVGHHLHEHGDPTRAVPLVHDLVVGRPFQLAGAALDRLLDVVLGHGDGPGLVDGVPQREVHGGVAAAGPGGDDDVPAELAEQLAPLGVHHGLVSHDVLGVTVPCHVA